MAHVGKFYKLWFRRDAAPDSNDNKKNYPEAYRFDSPQEFFSSRYAISQLRTVYAVNVSKDYKRIWRSETIGGFFDNAYWQVEFTDVPDIRPAKFRLSFWHDAVIDTPLFDATYGLSHHPGTYALWEGGAMLQLHFLSPDIVLDPDRLLPTISAAGWNIYNPAV